MINVRGKKYKEITKLDLSGKNLRKFPDEIFLCTNLRKLILSHNKIKDIPKEIINLKKLKLLDISHNSITQLYANAFKLPKLEILNLSFNSIKSIPRQIKESNVKTLLLQHNICVTLNKDDICAIEKLNISYNQVEELDLSMTKSALKAIWFSNNPIRKLNLEIESLPKLKQVYVYTKKCTRSYDMAPLYKSLVDKKGNSFNELIKNIPKTMNMNKEKGKHNIFISYSHDDDKTWLQLLQKNLKVLTFSDSQYDYWDDTRINVGSNWKEDIMDALHKAKVAILLVSTNFLGSDFIRNEELPKLLEQAEKEGTKILPVIVSACRFIKTPSISCFQAINSPEKTLEDCSSAENNHTMLKLMDEIELIFNEEKY